jgi:hypothetical protein
MQPSQVVAYFYVLIHAFVFMIGKKIIFLHKIDHDNLFIAIVLFVTWNIKNGPNSNLVFIQHHH